MNDYINTAVKNFFQEILSVRCEAYSAFPPTAVYTATISLEDSQTKHHFTLCMREETLRMVSNTLLHEEDPEEEIKMDLICECANLIVGSAKVAIEDATEQSDWQLSVPEYQGYFDEEFSKSFDDIAYFKVQDTFIMIGSEEESLKATV